MNNRIKIAVQSKGRLADQSRELLENCGLVFRKSKDKLHWLGENFPVDVIRLRDDDIPQVLQAGVCQLGIVGQNVAKEVIAELAINNKPIRFEEIEMLGFGKCRLSIAAPDNSPYADIEKMNGKTIATSYPNIVKSYLQSEKISADIVELKGSVEIAPSLGTADAIADLVSTGSTLAAHRLTELEVIMQSQAALYKTTEVISVEQAEIVERLLLRLKGYQAAKASKYVMLHAPKSKVETISQILPGAETPTLMTLDHDETKVALHAVCKEGVFWEHLEELKQAGATAILVLPVEKMLA